MIEILNLNYNEHVSLIGTAHFTKRSINETYSAVKSLKPNDIALELDLKRYRVLNASCTGCQRNTTCRGFCEFTGAADALGNIDANIWLIDLTEEEMKYRFKKQGEPIKRIRVLTRPNHSNQDPIQLWESGYKEEVLEYSQRQMEILRKISPSIPRVLMDERDTIMAARLAWITSNNLDEKKNSKIVAFIGAAHVKGVKKLLANPYGIKDRLRTLNLPFSKPTLIRRIAVQES